MRIPVTLIFALALALVFAGQGCGTGGRAVPAATTLPTALSAPIPTEAGHHQIQYTTTTDGRAMRMCVVVSNSQAIAKTPGRVPALIFLCGVGERGSDGQGVFYNGPAGEMVRHPALGDALPMMVISPQCPEDRRWSGPGMDMAVVQLVKLIAADPRIDPDRIYLTGSSLGGIGAWKVAAAGAKYFAAVVPAASPAVSPETVVPAVKDLPIWIVVGDKDEDGFMPGSLAMAAALRKAGADISLSLLPGVGHNSWTCVYSKLEFYQWLLAHTRGKPPAKKYTEDDLLKIAMAPLNDPALDKVNRDFAEFAPYWQILNCNSPGDDGIHAQANGRSRVLVVHPYNEQVPCLMMTTWKIPADKQARLSIIAGCDDRSDWKLIVRVAGKQVLAMPINSSTTRNNWYAKYIDLSAWAGKDVFVEVLACVNGDHPSTAYFARLGVDVQ